MTGEEPPQTMPDTGISTLRNFMTGLSHGTCVAGQSVLDVGTGTGVLPRNLYRYGAKWIGTDVSENQIAQARLLSEGMAIDYRTAPAEELDMWEQEHKKLLAETAPEEFTILHYGALAELKKKEAK